MPSSIEFPVFTETNLGTRIAISTPPDITTGDLKRKLGREHYLCFPNLGEVRVHALMVKRKSCFYHLPDSLLIKNAFQGLKGSWFLRMSATQVQHIHSQLAPTTDISNAMVGRKDRISQSMSGNNSVGSSGIISVTGILTRYFSESDERNIFNCQAESIRNPNELAEQSVDSQMQKLVEIQCTNNIGCTTGVEFSMKQYKHNKNTSENNMVHPLIDPYIEKSKCNIVSKISKKRSKTELSDKERSVASYDINDDCGDRQDNQVSTFEQSECNIATEISINCSKTRVSASVTMGITGLERNGRDAASDAITVGSGAHHRHRDSEVEKFHCNIATEISKKDSKTGMSTSAVTRSGGLDKRKRNASSDDIADDSGAHHGRQDFDVEVSKCNIGSKISKKCIKSKKSASVVIGVKGLGKKGISDASNDITDDNGAHQGHQDSDVDESECYVAANIRKKRRKIGVSSSLAMGRMVLDMEGCDVMNGTRQGHRDSDVTNSKCNFSSMISKNLSENETFISVATRPSDPDKNERNAASDDISNNKGAHQVHNSSKCGINGCCSRNVANDTQFTAKTPPITLSLPLLANPSTETPKSKLGKSDVGKRFLQAASKLSISARKQKSFISVCRSRTMVSSTVDPTSLA
ncbi:uncharacterized protein LOC131255809 [Magnolia sinica]|uniref:uncharacterized protein LOC131255809 n=1 Tax=Magnolia sinica TaxID=86752 RepID=UPI00265B17B5|nr:uncharacterized protein LOC131255809 [Magnolia sinica]